MRCLLPYVLLLLVASAAPTAHAQGADPDGDGIPAAQDNCDAWPNPGQADANGNGIGNDCECGDQDGSGAVDVLDLIAINLAIFNPTQATPLCDTNADGACDVADIIGANSKIFGRPAYCSRYPASPSDGDGDGFSVDEGDCDDGNPGVYPGAPVTTGSLALENLAQGVCFAAREPSGGDPREGSDGCSGIDVEGVLDANNPSGCTGAEFGSGDGLAPLPCDLHDACYATCGATQAQCDAEFLANMLAVCDTLPTSSAGCTGPCRTAALVYSGFVTALGEQAWLNGQRRKCECACEADTSGCGNDVCAIAGGESQVNCPADCGALSVGASCVLDADCASGKCGPEGHCTLCANGTCEEGESCRQTSTASCQADCGKCPAGYSCEADADCSGFCDALFFCRAKLSNGSVCLKDSACASGACNFGFCVAANSLPALTPCATAAACRSGSCPLGVCAQICGDGFCDGTEVCGDSDLLLQCNSDCGLCPNGTACTANSVCASNACNFGFCVAIGSVPVGGACSANSICASGACNFGFCVAANSLPALTPCTTATACRSGSCPAGTCAQICGDGFCDGAEVCGNSNVGLQCINDCGRCPNGTACTANSICASGACNFGFCVAANSLPALTPCTTATACRSGSCPAGTCAQICGDGFCDGTEACGGCINDCGLCSNGTACTANSICASNACNFGFCVASGSVGVGGSCTTANACSNNICQAGCCGRPLTAACTANSQCCSNLCKLDFLGNRSCALF